MNDNSPVLTLDNASVNLAEDAAAGVIVNADADATDADVGDTLTYAVTSVMPQDGSGNDLFSINTTTGQISLTADGAAFIDYETAPNSYTLDIQASDGTNLSNTETLTINLTDVNDNSPVLTLDNASVNLAEDAAAGVIVNADADATDADVGDTLTYAVTSVMPQDGSGNDLFSINTTTGQISLTADGAAFIDYETAPNSYTLDIQASDGTNLSNTETLTINLTDVNDNSPVLTLDNASVNLAEDAAAGVIVNADADATDADVGDTLTYAVTSVMPQDGSGNDLFSINTTTGQISLTADGAAFIDYETAPNSYTLDIQASDGTNLSNTETLTINLTDVNDNSPVLTLDNASVNLAEDAAAGVIVNADADATDADVGDTLTYAVTSVMPQDGSGNDLFSINTTTGQISLTADGAAFIDYETAPNSYTLDIQASDGTNLSNTETLTINLTDVNDNSPVLTLDNASVNLAEDAAAGVIVNADADATDADVGDTLTYAVTSVMPQDGSGNDLFSINTTTGQISLTADGAAFIDYETAPNSYTLDIQASDGTNLSNTETLTINLTDVNDNSPVLTLDNASVNLAEDAAAGVIVNADADATDADVGDTLTYAVTSVMPQDGSGNDLFSINTTTGQISLTADGAAFIDYETAPNSYTLDIQASDGTNLSNTETLTINLTDVNDNSPVLTLDNASVNLAEDAAAGVIVNADADATDADVGDTLTYAVTSVMPQDGSGNDLFSINTTTGQISLTADGAAFIDYETAPNSYTLDIQASDGTNLSNTETLTINLTDVNDNSPVLTLDNASVNLAEDAAAGVIVNADADATDADVGDTLTYAVTSVMPQDGSGNDLFSINTTTGQISLTADGAAFIDYETAPNSYTLDIQASDGTNLSNTETLTINLTDVNDNSPVLTLDNASVNLAEDAAAGVIVNADADATDADVGDTLTYAVTSVMPQDGSGNDLFSINTTTGQISLTADGAAFIDYETAPNSYTLDIQASDGTNLSNTETLTINLTDVNDNSPVLTLDNASVNLAEDAAAGVIVNADADATDADVGDTLTYAVTSVMPQDGSGNDLFSINTTTGQISLTADGAAFIDYETAPNSYTLDIQASDGTNLSNTETLTINLTDVNDPPALDLDGDDSTSVGTGYAGGFTEGGGAVDIADADIVITDVDDTNIEGATITLTNAQTADALAAVGLPASISLDGASTATNIILTGSATLADYQAAIAAITFNNTSESPDTTDRVINVTVTDGDDTSNTAVSTISVTAVNDPPVAVVDTDTTDRSTVLNVPAGSGVLANDTDVDGDTLTVSQVNGNAASVGAQITLISGALLTLNADGSYDYDPNSAFDGLNAGVRVADSFSYTVSDGNGGSDTTTVTVIVTDPNLGPDARDDLHTLDPFEIAVGNVVTAVGTDGGTSGSGVDVIVDDAVVTEFTYKGSTITLDSDDLTLSPWPDPAGHRPCCAHCT